MKPERMQATVITSLGKYKDLLPPVKRIDSTQDRLHIGILLVFFGKPRIGKSVLYFY
jgi:hypothetical protein